MFQDSAVAGNVAIAGIVGQPRTGGLYGFTSETTVIDGFKYVADLPAWGGDGASPGANGTFGNIGTVGDGPGNISISVTDTIGRLYRPASGEAAAASLSFSGDAAAVSRWLSALSDEAVAAGFDTVTLTASDSGASITGRFGVSVMCFVAGTTIATPKGESAVTDSKAVPN